MCDDNSQNSLLKKHHQLKIDIKPIQLFGAKNCFHYFL